MGQVCDLMTDDAVSPTETCRWVLRLNHFELGEPWSSRVPSTAVPDRSSRREVINREGIGNIHDPLAVSSSHKSRKGVR